MRSEVEKNISRYIIYGLTMPFENEREPSDDEIINRNLFGNNIGNIYFYNAVVRSLTCAENRLCHYHNGMDLGKPDVGILIYANIFRSNNEQFINQEYDRIRGTDIPYVLVCAGSDSNPEFETRLNSGVSEISKKLLELILERSASIGVRGEMTKKVLVEQVGIKPESIDVIGCPSVRYFGKNLLKFPRKYPEFSKKLKIAVNFTAYHYDNDEAIYLYQLLKNHRNSFVVFTDKVEADMLFHNVPIPEGRRHELLPTTRNHFMIKENRVRFLLRQDEMMRMMRTFDFSIGSRIHQAIVAILSGCPALLIAHSSRVLEIAQHHKIPYILRSELTERNPCIEELYYRACAGMIEFYNCYDTKLTEYSDFLIKNGLRVNPEFIL